jgi:hypothetical protein
MRSSEGKHFFLKTIDYLSCYAGYGPDVKQLLTLRGRRPPPSVLTQ